MKDWAHELTSYNSTSQALEKVHQSLLMKQQIVVEIQQKLLVPKTEAFEVSSDSDKLDMLTHQARELENTLRLRLGLLRVENRGAWFRPAITRNCGPLGHKILVNPVFEYYDDTDVDRVAESLRNAYFCAKEAEIKGFQKGDVSLWRLLIRYVEQLQDISVIKTHFCQINLNESVIQLPPALESRHFRIFLGHLKERIDAIKIKLDICYHQLHDKSTSFWIEQRKRQKQSSASRSTVNEKQTRRQAAYSSVLRLNQDQLRALQFMGFESLPDRQTLRHRYWVLARKMHPDCPGGQEEAFKFLNQVYHQLCCYLDQIQHK